MWKAGALLILAISVVTADDPGTATVSHTAESFDAQVEESKHFVMFFAPWCGHCKRLAPTWDKLAQIYNNKAEKEVIIAKVDCTTETALCANHDVTGYPTLKFFPEGKEGAVRYKGSRDLTALQEFVEEQIGKEPEEEDEKHEMEMPKGPLYDLDQTNFDEFIETGNHFIKFFAPWCGHCKRLAPTWEDLAKSYEDDDSISISKVDCTQNQQICSSQGVRGYPTLLFFKDGQKVEKYAGQRDLEALQNYVKTMLGRTDDKADAAEEKVPEKKVETVTEKPPPKEPSVVFELTDKNFNFVTTTGTAFVKFYAPWCGHCKRLVPVWEDLAKQYSDLNNIFISKIDCTQYNDICKEFKVNGYPTLMVFKDGKKVAEYNGSRNLDALQNFFDEFVYTKPLEGHDEF